MAKTKVVPRLKSSVDNYYAASSATSSAATTTAAAAATTSQKKQSSKSETATTETVKIKSEPGVAPVIKKSRPASGKKRASGTHPATRPTASYFARAARLQHQAYSAVAVQMVLRLAPQARISKTAMSTLASLLQMTVNRVNERVVTLFQQQGRRMITPVDALLAVRTLLPEPLYQVAGKRATETIAVKHGNEALLERLYTVAGDAKPFGDPVMTTDA